MFAVTLQNRTPTNSENQPHYVKYVHLLTQTLSSVQCFPPQKVKDCDPRALPTEPCSALSFKPLIRQHFPEGRGPQESREQQSGGLSVSPAEGSPPTPAVTRDAKDSFRCPTRSAWGAEVRILGLLLPLQGRMRKDSQENPRK